MPFEAHPDRRKIATLLAIAVAFVLIGVRLAGGFGSVGPIRGWSPEALHVFGWIAIVFFGFGVAVLVSRLGAKSFGHVTLSLQGTDGNFGDMRAAFDYFAPGRRDDSAP